MPRSATLPPSGVLMPVQAPVAIARSARKIQSVASRLVELREADAAADFDL